MFPVMSSVFFFLFSVLLCFHNDFIVATSGHVTPAPDNFLSSEITLTELLTQRVTVQHFKVITKMAAGGRATQVPAGNQL